MDKETDGHLFDSADDTQDTEQDTKTDEDTNDNTDDTSQDEKSQTKSEDTSAEDTEDASGKDDSAGNTDEHRQVIDLVEDKFNELTPEEIKKWFETNPQFANVANRSKRLKERYRGLDKLIESRSTEKKEVNTDKGGSEKELDPKAPLTMETYQQMLAKQQEELASKSIEKENQTILESIAKEKGVTDEAFRSLGTTAKAIYSANEEMSFAESVNAAFVALNMKKGSSVNLGSTTKSETSETEEKEDEVDLSKESASLDFLRGE